MQPTSEPWPDFPRIDTLGRHRLPSAPANFLCSFLFHAAFIALIWLLARSVSPATPARIDARAWQAELPIIFSGTGGGSGGSQDLLPASRGALPRAKPDEQFVPPSAVLIKDSPALPMEPLPSLLAADAVPPQTGPLGGSALERHRTVVERAWHGWWNWE